MHPLTLHNRKTSVATLHRLGRFIGSGGAGSVVGVGGGVVFVVVVVDVVDFVFVGGGGGGVTIPATAMD